MARIMNKQLTVSVDNETLERLTELSNKMLIGRSMIVRKLIEKAMNNYDRTGKLPSL